MNSQQEHMVLVSAGLSVDAASGQVHAGAECIRLGPVNMKVLALLLESRNRVVTRNEFFDHVWKQQVVSDDVLTRSISDLRTQLGAHTELTLIETIPKRGYRWVPPVATGTTPVYAPAPVPEARPVEGRRPWYRAAFAIVGVVLTASVMLWALGSVFTSGRIKMALLPLQADAAAQQTATELEGMLHEQLLASGQFDMLAFSATALYLQNPFPALAREYGVAYVVEGRVQARGEEIRITLNLVDARSASVIDSIVADIPGSSDLRLLGESAATQFSRHLQSSR